MKKCIAAFLMFFVLLAMAPAFADNDARSSGNPNNQGYTLGMSGDAHPVAWVPYHTTCQQCDSLVESYNILMTQLFTLRYRLGQMDAMQGNQREMDKTLGDYQSRTTPGEGLTPDQQAGVAYYTQKREGVEAMQKLVPGLEAQEHAMTDMAEDLKNRIDACVQQYCVPADDKETRPVVVTGGGQTVSANLPFPWRGPYPETCHKCAKLAERLNELPALARKAIANIEKAKAQKIIAESEIAQLQAMVSGDYKEKDVMGLYNIQSMDQNEAIRDAADAEIARETGNLDKIKQNFEDTLKLYQDCVKTCQPEQKTGMVDPPRGGGCHGVNPPQQALVVGPNSQYGSGAQMKNKVTDMAGGALGSLLGGSHGSGMGSRGGMMGGGIGREGIMGGGGGQKGPETESDPTRHDDFVHVTQGGIDLGTRVMGQDANHLLVSQKIFDAPGDGTFQTMFLQDDKGHIVQPLHYFIYTLYQDWKLTVWWTYDKWVDGEHVYHDEGKEITAGRNNLGSWIKYYEGVENSIWANLGFKTATKGIQGLGAEFDTSKLDLNCPLTLSTYVTAPKADPVTAAPVSVMLAAKPEVTMSRTKVKPTEDDILWVVIRNSSSGLGFDSYQDFMDGVMGH